MYHHNSDDAGKLGPNVISTVREGSPRGGQSDDFAVSRKDSCLRRDSNIRRELLPNFGFGYQSGRQLD